MGTTYLSENLRMSLALVTDGTCVLCDERLLAAGTLLTLLHEEARRMRLARRPLVACLKTTPVTQPGTHIIASAVVSPSMGHEAESAVASLLLLQSNQTDITVG